jgi:signal transduction histidine kinase
MPLNTRSMKYICSILFIIAAVLVRLFIAPQEVGIPYVTFFPAVALSAIIGGMGAGLLATTLGVFVATYLFIPPFNELKLTPEAIWSGVVFCADGVVVCTAIEAMHRYYHKYVRTVAALTEAKDCEERARKTAEDAMRAEALSRIAAENANLAKSRFLAAASHDLRQPYQALRLFHGVLQTKAQDPEIIKVLDRMEIAMSAGEELLRGLLDVSTLDAGLLAPRSKDISIAALCEDIEARHRPEAEAKGLGFHLKAYESSLHIDPILMGRIIDNLVSNAIRFTTSGSVRVAFRLCAGRPTFLVKDTGIGIAPEHQEAVFEEFFQVDNAARDRAHGIGLGLAVARKTATLMGLDLKMKSRLGKGTLITVSMPAAPYSGLPSPVN